MDNKTISPDDYTILASGFPRVGHDEEKMKAWLEE